MNSKKLLLHYIRRGYPAKLLSESYRKVNNLHRQIQNYAKSHPAGDKKRFFLITTFNPALPSVNEMARRHWDIFSSTPQTESVHKAELVLGFRRGKNLKDLLTNARVNKKPKEPIRLISHRGKNNRIPKGLNSSKSLKLKL